MKLNNFFNYNKKIRNSKKKKKKKKKSAITDDSKLIYDSKYSFTDYSFTTKYDKLLSFYHRLNEFRNLVPQKEKTKNKKESA